MRVFRKFQSSDGRIKVATLSGVSALVAVIALLVGVLPAMGYHSTTEGALVNPSPVTYGGGAGACDFVDSAADKELHINNPTPTPGEGTTYTDADGIKIRVKVYDRPEGRVFDFRVLTENIGVYDVVVNGGRQNNHYAYNGSTIGVVTADKLLHAPTKQNSTTDLHNLSHINICYDIQPTLFQCGVEESALRFGEQGDFTGATATIFSVNGITENCEKSGFFFIEDGEATLDFGTGGGVVTGRSDFFKEFDNFDGTADFEDLQYDGGPAEGFEEVPWCAIDESGDPGAFGELESGSPELPAEPAGHTACKVAEIENAAGVQHTVVYFEFEDPQFR